MFKSEVASAIITSWLVLHLQQNFKNLSKEISYNFS